MHYKSSLRSLKLVLLGLLLACGAVLWAAPSDLPIHYEIMRFPTLDSWSATSTLLEPTPSGRLRLQSVSSHFLGGNCDDILTGFQRPSLTQMRKDGYISAREQVELLRLTEMGIRLTQVVLVRQFSLKDDAKRLGVPLTGVAQERLEDVNRILRGTVYAVLGYEPKTDANHQRVVFNSLDVPWEIGIRKSNPKKFPTGLTRPFDRTKAVHLVEVGRALAWSGALPGDFKKLIHVLVANLANETRALKLDPRQILLTAHSLDAQHARLFTRGFPVRLLNDALTEKIETSLEAHRLTDLETILDEKLPVGKEWQNYPDTISVGTLADAVGQFPLADISNAAEKIKNATGGRATPEQAIDFQSGYISVYRQAFDFVDPRFPLNTQPIALRDLGTSDLEDKLIRTIRTLGKDLKRNEAEAWSSSLDLHLGEPDGQMSMWYEKGLMLPIDPRIKQSSDGVFTPAKTLVLSNFDPDLVKQNAMTYLASVIIAVVERLEERLNNLNPEAYANHKECMNVARKELGLPLIQSVNLETYLATYSVVVASLNPEVNEQLLRLGGKKIPGIYIHFSHPHGPDDTPGFKMGVDIKEKTYIAFDASALRSLRQGFQSLVPPGELRRRLRPGIWDTQLKLLMSGGL